MEAMPTTEKTKKKKAKKSNATTAAASESKYEIAGTAQLVDAVRALLKATIEAFSSIRSIFRARSISAEVSTTSLSNSSEARISRT